MNPSEINRINYNCYYVGQNLDQLCREKMKSESLNTPLKVTPKYFDDEVTTKMKLLGNRGHYFPSNFGVNNQFNVEQNTNDFQNMRNNDNYICGYDKNNIYNYYNDNNNYDIGNQNQTNMNTMKSPPSSSIQERADNFYIPATPSTKEKNQYNQQDFNNEYFDKDYDKYNKEKYYYNMRNEGGNEIFDQGKNFNSNEFNQGRIGRHVNQDFYQGNYMSYNNEYPGYYKDDQNYENKINYHFRNNK